MMGQHSGTLSRQFIILVLAFSVVAVALTSLFSVHEAVKSLSEKREEVLKRTETEWLPLLGRATWILSETDIKLIIFAIEGMEGVEHVKLEVFGHGTYSAGFFPEHHGITENWPVTWQRSNEEAPRRIGTLSVTVHHTTFREGLRSLFPALLPREMLKIALILLPLFFLVQGAITRQLNKLSRQIASGREVLDLNRRKIFPGDDEFDHLVSSYNRLMVEIEQERQVRLESEESLKAGLKEKEVLLREVHHRVKNNLQIIISLLHLQEGSIKQKKIRKALQEAQRRIASLALVHEQLYQQNEIGTVELSGYIESLMNTLASSFDNSFNETGAAPVRISVSGGPVNIDLDRAIPLALILNELCINAFEHAFPSGKESSGEELTLSVSLTTGENSFTVKLCDNGKGLPEGFDITLSQGIGLTIVSSLIEQIDGTLIHYCPLQGGTCFELNCSL